MEYAICATEAPHFSPITMLILPNNFSPGNENMAEDSIILEHASISQQVCFRHYGWNENAYTFGYFQPYLYVKNYVNNNTAKLYRRPTGGGILSHTNDWTYSLAIPHSHKDFRTRPCELYRKIHTCASAALNKQGMNTEPLSCSNKTQGSAIKGVCFTNAELFDIIDVKTGNKLAGAAMKRNQSGILIQGSIDKTNLLLDWTTFYTDFINELSRILETKFTTATLPNHPKRNELYNKFNSLEWNQKR